MMTDIKCPPTPELRSFVVGQLSDESSDALVDHLRHCPDCAARIETIDDAEDSFIADLRGLSPLDPSDISPHEQIALAKALGALCLVGEPGLPIDLPQSIGEYEIVRPLGHGGMGSVFLARHTKLGRQVALKVLATHRLVDGRMRERFEAEMRAVGRLSHPNIVTAHDARDVDGTAVLVTEFIDGLDLGQLLQRTGPLLISNACEIARQVAVALQYVHEQGFVHRDVKPSNIMLSRAGEVKLLDLGLARLQYGDPDHAEITATGQAMGTADYIAPEQVTDSRQVDIRSDLYALGCTLMKLLTGTAPFADEAHLTPFAKMSAHVSTPAPALNELLPDAPVELTKLIDRLLQKDPAQRPQQPKDLMQVLVPLAKGSDLGQLAAQSVTLPARPNPEPRAASTAARPQVRYRRPVPISAAIAAGFLGAFAGLCCGILITIKYPDGTQLTIDAPEGSQVSVGADDAAVPANSTEELRVISPAVTTSESTNSADALETGVALDLKSLASPKLQLQIDEFNQKMESEYRQLRQPPLTLEEYFACTETQPIKGMLSDFQKFEAIPGDWKLRGGETKVKVEAGLLSVWEVTLQNGFGARQIIRRQFLRPEFDLPAEPAASDVDSISLEKAIDELNKVHAQILNVPLTEDEVVAAIYEWGLHRDQTHVSREVFEDFLHIAKSHALPQGYSLNLGGNLKQGETYLYGTLSISITTPEMGVKGKIPSFNFDIREWYDIYPKKSNNTEQPRAAPFASSSLEIIGLAFHNFHDVYRKFPGGANVREGGLATPAKPIKDPFSWRVAILPFIEQAELFEQYRFHEPWDSLHNLTLLDKMPAIYRSPSAPADQPKGNTNYLGYAGEGGMLVGSGADRDHCRDGTANTALIAESKRSVPWTKPEDLTSLNIETFANAPLRLLMVDGKVIELQQPVAAELLDRLFIRNDGRPVALEELR